MALGGCSDSTGPAPEVATCKTATPDAQIPLTLFPRQDRVDLDPPSFSSPAVVSNPLFPISQLHSAVLLGSVGGEPFRTETTLLATTKTIDLGGEEIEVLVSQYMALINGRIEEVALDWYGQADDGSVWYFGEDVFNYENGVLSDVEGTWVTCDDGPAAMIMPANPQVGDVYRPENAYPLVFEEVIVRSVGQTVNGPTGPVAGAITVEELHMDGTREDKIFAPGYGEFSTGSGGDLEAMALAVPTDALAGPPPSSLVTLSNGAYSVFDAAHASNLSSAAATLNSMNNAWNTYQAGGAPPMLETQMDDALAALDAAITATDAVATRHAALDVALATFDFQLRYRPRVEIDYVRLDLWARRLQVDTEANDTDGIASDVAIIEWVWDRLAPPPEEAVTPIGDAIVRARAAQGRADHGAVLRAASEIRVGVGLVVVTNP
jgi:hypothetical protein